MSKLDEVITQLAAFCDERDWAQFHDPKNLAAAISIEAAELNELYLWKSSTQDIDSVDRQAVADELADILAFTFLMTDRLGFDPIEILQEKIRKNAEKYPASKVRGISRKYDQYQDEK